MTIKDDLKKIKTNDLYTLSRLIELELELRSDNELESIINNKVLI